VQNRVQNKGAEQGCRDRVQRQGAETGMVWFAVWPELHNVAII
jgi:hypothetical protein